MHFSKLLKMAILELKWANGPIIFRLSVGLLSLEPPLPILKIFRRHISNTHDQSGSRVPITCDICEKKLCDSVALKRHKVFVHKEKIQHWICEKCAKKKKFQAIFFSEASFYRHMENKH